MFSPVIFGFLFLVGLIFLMRSYILMNPSKVKKYLIYILILFLTVFFVFLSITGRLGAAFGVLVAIFAFGRRVFGFLSIIRWLKSFNDKFGKDNKKESDLHNQTKSYVQTKYLNMTLDHNTGHLDGKFIIGKYKDRFLSDLSLMDLIDIRQDIFEDADSVGLLESYLDRSYKGWKDKYKTDNDATSTHKNTSMNVDEAEEILGVKKSVSEEEIKKAYKALMNQFHPDKGGSSYLASKINQAKDILLNN